MLSEVINNFVSNSTHKQRFNMAGRSNTKINNSDMRRIRYVTVYITLIEHVINLDVIFIMPFICFVWTVLSIHVSTPNRNEHVNSHKKRGIVVWRRRGFSGGVLF